MVNVNPVDFDAFKLARFPPMALKPEIGIGAVG